MTWASYADSMVMLLPWWWWSRATPGSPRLASRQASDLGVHDLDRDTQIVLAVAVVDEHGRQVVARRPSVLDLVVGVRVLRVRGGPLVQVRDRIRVLLEQGRL